MSKSWRLQGVAESYQVTRRYDVSAGKQDAVDPALATLYVDRWLADPFTQRSMVEMYESVTGRSSSSTSRLRGLDLHRYIKPEIIEAFRRGDFVLLRVPHETIIPVKEKKKEEPREEEQPAPAPEEKKKKTWIEIELVDDDDNPVPNARFRLELPDGTMKSGTLGDNGKARITGIEPGTCKVSFLDVDASEWEMA